MLLARMVGRMGLHFPNHWMDQEEWLWCHNFTSQVSYIINIVVILWLIVCVTRGNKQGGWWYHKRKYNSTVPRTWMDNCGPHECNKILSCCFCCQLWWFYLLIVIKTFSFFVSHTKNILEDIKHKISWYYYHTLC